jgi:hypothetical protein
LGFFSPANISAKIASALDRRSAMEKIRSTARQSVIEHSALRDLLPRHLQFPRHLQLIRHLAGSVEPAEKHHLHLAASA